MTPIVSQAFRQIIYSYKFRLYFVDHMGYLFPVKTWKNFILSYAILFDIWIYVMVEVVLSIKVFSKPTSIDQRVLCLLWTAGYSVFLIFVTQSFCKRTEISNFINRFFTLDFRLRAKYELQQTSPDVHYVIIKIIRFMPWSMGVTLGAMYLQAPQSSQYFYSQLSFYSKCWVLQLLCFVYEVFTGVTMWLNAMFILIILGSYVYNTSCWLNYFISTESIKPEFFVPTYRALQLLNKEFNACYATLVIPTLIGLLVLGSFCSATVIRFHHDLKWITTIFLSFFSLFCALVVVFAFQLPGALYHSSNVLILHKSFPKSQSLKVCIGNFGFFKRTATVLAVFSLSMLTVRTIIALS